MKKIIIYTIALLFVGCKKADLARIVSEGEGLDGTSFVLSGPRNADSVKLNAATPNETVVFSWTAVTPGVKTEPTYTLVASLKSAGNLDAPIISVPADNSGAATRATLTYKRLDDILAARGIPAGARVELIWSVVADNGSTTLSPAGFYGITVTRFNDGASPFYLLQPASSTNTVEIEPGSTTASLKFNWTKSVPAKPAQPVSYRLWIYDTTMNPLFSIPADNNGTDSLVTITYRDFSDSLTKYGFTDLSETSWLRWNVVATSGTWNQTSSYTNDLNILREVKIYLVGGSTPIGWEPGSSLQMIPDEKFAGAYYIYVYLTSGGGGIKFLNQKEWPGGPLNSTDWGMKPGSPGELAADGEDNVPVPVDGVYRVTFDLPGMKYYVQAEHGRMATVGDATPAGWDPGSVFPAQALGLVEANLFLGILNFNGGGNFKLIDGASWPDGGGPISQSKDFGRGEEGELKEQGEDNIPGPAAGRYRIVWDGREVKNLKYEISPASEMRVVGNAMVGFPDWTPDASPQMVFQGNGIWKVTLTLRGGAEFKFLAGNAWGALDYEDAGGGRIKYDGGPNFMVPAGPDRSYTITLNEHTGTYTLE